MKHSRLVAAALEYAARGWAVFPLNGKEPFKGTRGHRDATTDPARIRAMWRERPTANVGVACSSAGAGPIVVDIDGPEGERSVASLSLPATWSVKTGRGRHLYFAPAQGHAVARRIGVLPKVDVLGDGGYVVAPPSVHPETGQPYETLVDAPLVAFPVALFPNGNGRKKKVRQGIAQGTRNNALTSIAGAMRRQGVEPDAIHAALSVLNESATDAPLPEAEIEQIARSVGRYEPEAAAPAGEVFTLLRTLLENPELLREPQYELPHLAHRGRTTLLAAPDKAGKSTLMRHGAAAKSRGRPFLGWPTEVANVVWVGLEEALGDAVRLFHELDPDPERLRLLLLDPGSNLPSLLDELLREWPAPLVIVDSLAEYARKLLGQAPDNGDAAAWGAVVRPLVELGRRHDSAMVLLHHPRRSDGQYRGSGEIAAAVDCLFEMRRGTTSEDPTLRRFTGRARWPVKDFAIRLVDGRFEVDGGGGGPLPLDKRVELDVQSNPGTRRTGLRERVVGTNTMIRSAIDRLIASGVIHDRSGRLYPGPGVVETARRDDDPDF